MAKQTGNKSLFPILMMGVGLILISFVLLRQIIVKSQTPGNSEPFPTQVQSELPFPDVTRISLADAKAAYDAGSAVFIDVRDATSFDNSHIPGALNIELASLPSNLKNLNPTKPIITYCTWPAEESSARAASILKENGFLNVAAIEGGFGAWRNANYPLEP